MNLKDRDRIRAKRKRLNDPVPVFVNPAHEAFTPPPIIGNAAWKGRLIIQELVEGEWQDTNEPVFSLRCDGSAEDSRQIEIARSFMAEVEKDAFDAENRTFQLVRRFIREEVLRP